MGAGWAEGPCDSGAGPTRVSGVECRRWGAGGAKPGPPRPVRRCSCGDRNAEPGSGLQSLQTLGLKAPHPLAHRGMGGREGAGGRLEAVLAGKG